MMPVLLQATEMSHTLTLGCAQVVDCWPPGLGEAVLGRCNPVLLAQDHTHQVPPAPSHREGLGRACGGGLASSQVLDTWLPPSASLLLSGLALAGSRSSRVSVTVSLNQMFWVPARPLGKPLNLPDFSVLITRVW